MHSPYDTKFGNGEQIPQEVLDKIRIAWWESSVAMQLRDADIVIVDNRLAGHGRLPWTPGVPRRMLLTHFK